MARFLKVGETGKATFSDGAEGMKSAEAMALENHPTLHPDGEFAIFQELPLGYNYLIQQHNGALFLTRRENKAAAKTEDSERSRLLAIQARNEAFWARPNPARKPTTAGPGC